MKTAIWEVIGWIAAGLLGGSTLIQISPIKLNPWSWLAKKIGEAVNKPLMDKIEKIETKVDKLEKSRGEENAENRRVRILRFSDELQHGVRHSQEHFDQILLDITVYNQYCADHKDFLNDRTVIATERIKSSYRTRLERNDFL